MHYTTCPALPKGFSNKQTMNRRMRHTFGATSPFWSGCSVTAHALAFRARALAAGLPLGFSTSHDKPIVFVSAHLLVTLAEARPPPSAEWIRCSGSTLECQALCETWVQRTQIADCSFVHLLQCV